MAAGANTETVVDNTTTTPTTPTPTTTTPTPTTTTPTEPTSPTTPVSTTTTSGTGTTTAEGSAWVDDALPAGAVGLVDGDAAWNWVTSNPTPFAGTKAHQSSLKAGRHEHLFNWAWEPMTVAAGDYLFTHVYLDPANPPSQVMLQWNDGTWEHRAYWGANKIAYGSDGTAGRRYVGSLPPAGQWVRLEVPAYQVALEGKSVKGVSFALFDGRATFDFTGKSSQSGAGAGTTQPPPAQTNVVETPTPPPTTPPSTTTPSEMVKWVDDAIPAGGVGMSNGDPWAWTSSNPAPFSGNTAHRSTVKAGLHEHYFNWAYETLSVRTGETLFAYIYLDPSNPPTEVMLHWNDGSWDHRAYWGANRISYGTDGSAGRRHMGPLPQAGQWVRLDVPARLVNLEGSTIKGMTFSLYDGQATWDAVGKYSGSAIPSTNTPPVTTTNTPPVTTTNTPPVTITNTPPVTTTNHPPVTTTNTPPVTTTNTPPVHHHTTPRR